MKSLIFLFLYIFPPALFAFPLTDARNLALGGLALSSSSIDSSVFINPAGLAQSEGLRTAFTQTRLTFSDFDFGISASFPLVKKQWGIGAGWDALASRNQVLTGFVRGPNGQYILDPVTGMPQTQVLGFFTQSTNTFYLSSGFQFGANSLGASLKYYLSDFGGTEGTGWGLDLAIRSRLGKGLFIAATLFDLGDRTLHFNDSTPDQKTKMMWASSLSWVFWDNNEFSLMAEPGLFRDVWDDMDTSWAAGLEGTWRKNVFLRVGYNQSGFSLGVGLAAHPEKIFKEIRVDYAYLGQSPDGYPSRLTLSVAW